MDLKKNGTKFKIKLKTKRKLTNKINVKNN